jgi:acyl-CoA synthetase (NDP forming)
MSVRALFEANSIAIVGASPRSALLAGMVQRLVTDGFTGPLWMLNPKYPEVFGFPAYASPADLPGVPDLVVVAVRASAVAQTLEEAARLGTRAAIVVSTGFADAGTDEGRTALAGVQRVARERDLAVFGPGSFGFAIPRRHLTPFAGGARDATPAGDIGVVAQSGGFANVLALEARARGFGFAALVATGSEGVLNASDVLLELVEDEHVRVLVAVLEEIRGVETFRTALERARELGKPVIVVPLGRSDAGQRATSAHSGALATPAAIQQAFLRDLGAIVVTTLDDCIETMILASAWGERVPTNAKPLFLTVSGGDCSLVLDLASDAGLDVPELAPATQTELHAIVADSTMLFNPLDIGTLPLVQLDLGPRIMRTAAVDPAVNLIMTRLYGGAREFRAAAEAAAEIGKPHLAFTRTATPLDPALLDVAHELHTPILLSPDRALGAVVRLTDAARERAQRRARVAPVPPSDEAVRLFGQRMSEADALDVLRSHGVPAVEVRRAASADEAVAAARAIGFPVALKIDSPDIEHKSEIGAVRLGLGSGDEVRRAFDEVRERVGRERPDARIRGAIVQPMMRPELELILGAVVHERFGAFVMVGFGGLLAEVLGRAQFRAAPVAPGDALDALEQLLSAKRGHKNWRNLDVAAAADALARFSAFVAFAAPYVEAIDINPLGVFSDGRGAAALDCLILPKGSTPA